MHYEFRSSSLLRLYSVSVLSVALDLSVTYISCKNVVSSVVRQERYLRAKTGGIDDEMEEDDEDEEKPNLWSAKKSGNYEGDNAHTELTSSDNESLDEEEAEVVRLQKE